MAGHVLEFAAASGLERQRLEGLRDVLDYVKHESPLYERKLKGVDLRSIQTLEDVARLPFTTRGDLQDAAPFGSLCRSARPEAYYESSGTSGAAVPGFPDLSAGKARSFAQFLDIWLGLSRSKVTRALVAFAYEMNPAGVRFQTALPYVGVMAMRSPPPERRQRRRRSSSSSSSARWFTKRNRDGCRSCGNMQTSTDTMV